MLKAYVNNIEYDVNATKMRVSEKLSNKTSTRLSIIVADGQAFPQSNQIVELIDDDSGDTFFLGYTGVPTSPTYKSGNEVNEYDIVCGNGNSILANRNINIAIEGKTITQLVQDLFDDYISAEGITLGTISTIALVFEKYVVPDLNLQQVLNELAGFANAVWQVTSDRVFNFIAFDDFPKFSETIDQDFLDAKKLNATDLKRRETNIDFRTVQIIKGAKGKTSPQSEDKTYDGVEHDFDVNFPIAERPTLYINSVLVDDDKIGVRGIDDEDETKVFYYTVGSTTISYVDSSGEMVATDVLTVDYIGEFNIRYEAENSPKIQEIAAATDTSGRIERVQVDESIDNNLDAVNTLDAFLDNYGESRVDIYWQIIGAKKEGTIEYDYNDFPLGKMVTFNLPEKNITGDFVIIERDIDLLSAEDPITNMNCRLKMVSRNYIKSYGEIYKKYAKEGDQLSVREDDIIIKILSINEEVDLSETVELNYEQPLYPVATSSTAGLTAPAVLTGDMGGIYP